MSQWVKSFSVGEALAQIAETIFGRLTPGGVRGG